MDELYESIKQGMAEAIAHSCGEQGEAKVYCPRQVDVKAVRNKTGLSQDEGTPPVLFGSGSHPSLYINLHALRTKKAR